MKSTNKKNLEACAATACVASTISYEELVDKIGVEWERGRNNASRAVNVEYVQTQWRIGRYIVEFEQHGKARAKYGTGLIDRLAHDLTARHGRGFSRSKLIYARLFYIAFPKSATLSHLLSWSHYLEILKVSDPLGQKFFALECARSNWGVTHKDIGQMNLYLNYFAAEKAAPGDNPPIGIVLGSVRDQVVVEYAMRGITNRVFVSRYQLYLPDKEQLRRELAYAIEAEEGKKRANKRKTI